MNEWTFMNEQTNGWLMIQRLSVCKSQLPVSNTAGQIYTYTS